MSEKKTIGDLLSTTSPIIEVPEWQRNYSWDSQQVDAFWQDLVSFSNQYPYETINEQEYFLGSVVIVTQGSKNLLLDGQQRLATATILLSVIYEYLKLYDANAATRIAQKYIVDIDDATNQKLFKLTLNKFDRDFFRKEVQDFDNQTLSELKFESHKLIRQTLNFFKKRLEEKYSELGGGKKAHEWALRIRRVLTDHISVVAITSKDEDNAASVFETLNDRGIGLSTPDLLRNLLLRRANDPEREEILACWGSILEIEQEVSIEDFLRHYWISNNGDVTTRSLYREIKRIIESKNISSLEFSRSLTNESHYYYNIVTCKEADADLKKFLEALRTLNAKAIMPVILSAYIVGEANIDDKKRLLGALTCLYLRYNVICGLDNSRLESFVFEIAKQLRQKKDFDTPIKRIYDFMPTDNDFFERFKTVQLKKSAVARYILREIECTKRTTKELEISCVPDRVNLEHIYPERPNPKDRWGNHESVVDRLGNLTILDRRLNDDARNADFKTKKEIYTKSEIQITKELGDLESWNVSCIEKRQEEMSKLALGIWQINLPSRKK